MVKGSSSQTVLSLDINSTTLGHRTKKPPLINPLLSLDFSTNSTTLFFFNIRLPNLGGGLTAVNVANFLLLI